MELSEATSLANKFVTSLFFKVHSLPVSDRSGWAEDWWGNRGSRIPLQPALNEARRHLRDFASRRRIDRRLDRHLFLDISAKVRNDDQGRCPALLEGLCSIYDIRPITCRTIPMHYSRTASTLQSYLDQFTSRPGYQCDTSLAAPIVLEGNRIVDQEMRDGRERALEVSRADRRWKDRIVNMIENGDQAASVGLPTYDEILDNTDNGYATLLPMVVAWRVAAMEGVISSKEFVKVCQNQARLIKDGVALNPTRQLSTELLDSLAVYEFEIEKASRHASSGNSV